MKDHASFFLDLIQAHKEHSIYNGFADLPDDAPDEEWQAWGDKREFYTLLIIKLMFEAEEFLNDRELAKLKYEFGKWCVKQEIEGVRHPDYCLDEMHTEDDDPQKVGIEEWAYDKEWYVNCYSKTIEELRK